MKVYVDVDHWGFASEQEKYHFFVRHTPGNLGIWNSLYLTQDYQDSNFVVCFDNSSSCKTHRANGKKVIQVRQEPNLIQSYTRSSFADAHVDYQDDFHATFWFIDKPYDLLESLKYSDITGSKKKNCSAIFSNKHAYRNIFFSKLSPHNLDIDYFGRGIESIVGSGSFNGLLNQNGLCKYEGLFSYQRSIAIENSSQTDYFTEKLVDCFMTWTVPIYFGCPNIHSIFPKESIRVIDVSDIKETIEKIVAPITKIEIEAIGEARHAVMKKYNFWAALERAVERA